MPVNGCLRVLDPARGDTVIYSKLPAYLTDAIPLSDLSRIVTNPEKAAKPAFLSVEPEHTWCYYFTKAELALQTNDLDKVIELETEAASKGYAAEDPNEWLTFIEAHALKGEINSAQELSNKVLEADPLMRRGVCTVWKHLRAKEVTADTEKIYESMSTLKCFE
jgi:hypothetical protein